MSVENGDTKPWCYWKCFCKKQKKILDIFSTPHYLNELSVSVISISVALIEESQTPYGKPAVFDDRQLYTSSVSQSYCEGPNRALFLKKLNLTAFQLTSIRMQQPKTRFRCLL